MRRISKQYFNNTKLSMRSSLFLLPVKLLLLLLVLLLFKSSICANDHEEKDVQLEPIEQSVANQSETAPTATTEKSSALEEERSSDRENEERNRRPNWTFMERGVLVLEPSILKATPEKFHKMMQDHQSLLRLENDRTHHHDQSNAVVTPSVSSSPLLLLLVYDPHCPTSHVLLKRFERAAQLLTDFLSQPPSTPHHDHSHYHHSNPPLLGKMDGSTLENDKLAEYGIATLPKLLFGTITSNSVTASSSRSSDEEEHTADQEEECLWLEYTGRQGTAADIFQTTLHYYIRLVLACGGIHLQETVPTTNQSQDDDEDDGDEDPSASDKPDASSVSTLQVWPPHFQTLEGVQEFVTIYQDALLQYAVPMETDEYDNGNNNDTTTTPTKRRLQPGLPTDDYTADEKKYIRWLLYDEAESIAPVVEDFTMIVQCRPSSSNQDELSEPATPLYRTFDQMYRAMSSRRDRFFVTVEDCRPFPGLVTLPPDGSVLVYKIPVDFGQLSDPAAWLTLPHTQFMAPSDRSWQQEKRTVRSLKRDLVEFLVKTCTPSLLWFDRQVTAAIAFPLYRKVHAILFVDLHHAGQGDYSTDEEHLAVRTILRQFHRACHYHWRHSQSMDHDMVCLVVPSTETRLLTTLGIDIWSPLDASLTKAFQRAATAANDKNASLPEEEDGNDDNTRVLPTLLITDQRFRGTRRYYLERDAILHSKQADTESLGNAVAGFIHQFWNGALQPERKSDPRGPRTNAAGVRILTADSLDELMTAPAVNEVEMNGNLMKLKGGHSLVAFVGATCGHCKRFLVLWNQAAQLLRHIGWTKELVQLYQVDVALNDIFDLDIAVQWIPDLFYLPPDKSSFVAYNRTDDKLGDTTGAISDSMEIVEWFLNVAFASDEMDGQVSELLAGLEAMSAK